MPGISNVVFIKNTYKIKEDNPEKILFIGVWHILLDKSRITKKQAKGERLCGMSLYPPEAPKLEERQNVEC